MAVTVASRHKDNTLRRANNYGQYLPLVPGVHMRKLAQHGKARIYVVVT